MSRTIIWAGGLKAAPLASSCGVPQGHGGRINIQPDLTVEGFPNLYALGDFAVLSKPDGKPLPQLAAVAKQSGEWAAENILASIENKPRIPFNYRDKGILAMIGRNAAIAEIGEKRRELKGRIAYITWLGIHLALLSTFRQRVTAIIDWSWDYFGRTSALQILDRADSARINWDKK